MNKFCSTSSANRGNSLPSSPPTLCRGEGGISSDFGAIFGSFLGHFLYLISVMLIWREEAASAGDTPCYPSPCPVAPSSGVEPSSGRPRRRSRRRCPQSPCSDSTYPSLPPLNPPLILTSKGMFFFGHYSEYRIHHLLVNWVTDGLNIRHSLRHPSLPQDSRVVGVSHALLSRGKLLWMSKSHSPSR